MNPLYKTAKEIVSGTFFSVFERIKFDNPQGLTQSEYNQEYRFRYNANLAAGLAELTLCAYGLVMDSSLDAKTFMMIFPLPVIDGVLRSTTGSGLSALVRKYGLKYIYIDIPSAPPNDYFIQRDITEYS